MSSTWRVAEPHNGCLRKTRPATAAGVRGVHDNVVGFPPADRRAGRSLLFAGCPGRLAQGLAGRPALRCLSGPASSAIGAVARRGEGGVAGVLCELGLQLLQPGATWNSMARANGVQADESPQV